ncbi:MAG: hypothetical protein RBS77_01215 [Candidatus Moranbacteria bacterium]|jgi:capsular polysaccharide biosynthesis protein|nr:hypothetical protein [Candidatus Moranbacteria bacterium]
MELREYLKIFKDNYRAFFITVGIVLAIGLAFHLLSKEKYRVEMDLNVTRTGYQKDTTDYRYDEFYRLQADERFADTIVRWLGSKVVGNDIEKEAHGAEFEKLKAERLSSQMIKVSFIVEDKNQAQKITEAIDGVLSNKVSELNLEQKNPQWFKILVSYPVVSEQKINPMLLLAIFLSGGIFLGFWVVLIKHYLK